MRCPTQGGRLAKRQSMQIQLISYGLTHVLHDSLDYSNSGSRKMCVFDARKALAIPEWGTPNSREASYGITA